MASILTSTTLVANSHTESDDAGDMEPGILWNKTLNNALDKLPDREAEWLADPEHRKSFTTTQVMDIMQQYKEEYRQDPVQRFITKIDPIVSHFQAFAAVISTFANADPTGAGLVWGSLYLLLSVACKSQKTLERIIDMLSDMSDHLDLFGRWHQLFPTRSYSEVAVALQTAYTEIIDFCIIAVRYLRRKPIKNVLLGLFTHGISHDLHRSQEKIRSVTEKVLREVETAHWRTVQSRLDTIHLLVDVPPTPSALELPTIRIIPHSQNDRFFGRQEILQRIGRKLLPSDPNFCSSHLERQKRFALCGFGGSGKTQIALEYTYRHLDQYKVVIWILADEQKKIDQGFEEAARMMGLPRGTQSTNEVRAFVLQRLSASGDPYLLCFDNADKLSLINDCFPRDKKGSILVTSRDSVKAAEVFGDALTVPEFSIAEGCDFLRSLLPEVDDITSDDNKTALEDISTTFEGLPLALAQAGAFIHNGGCQLKDFLRRFQAQQHNNAISALRVGDYHATLFTVWDLSFHSLGERSRQILEILVYLDPDSIPKDMLAKGCVRQHSDGRTFTELEYMADDFELWNALRGLQSQSLVRVNKKLETISIHRFLQEQAFKHLCSEPSRRFAAFQRSLFLLSNYQPEFPNVTQHWSPSLFKESELCMAHITRLATRFLESPKNFAGLENKLGKLVFESASYQFERFHHEAATELFALARRVIEMAAEPNELYLSDCFRMEGRMFNESGKPTSAAESNRLAHKHALAAIEIGLISEDDQRIPRILTGLGNSLSQLKDFDKALAAQLEAKRLCGDVPPEKSDAITIIQLNLGFLLHHRGDNNNAEQILRATLQANPRTPPAMYALGNALLAKNNVDEAIAVHLNGHEIYMEMFGNQHALVGRCAYKVGEILLLHKGDHEAASAYIRKAMDIYRKQESPYYTVNAYARAARMLAIALEKGGRLPEAERYYQEAWKLRERIDGIHGSRRDTHADYTSAMFYWDQ